MELNVNEPLMKHRYCYQVTSKVGFLPHPMTRREATCLLSLRCTVCRWQDHYTGSLTEREKQTGNVKGKCQRRKKREAESTDVPVCDGFLCSSVEAPVMGVERREKRIQWNVLCNLTN